MASAWAGRLFVTGHDADSHCATGGDEPPGQCHFVGAVTSYVRGGAPNPSKPLLLLDCTRMRSLQLAVNNGLGPTQSTTMCPSKGSAFQNEPLTTAAYSAILVGSSGDSINQNAVETTPDSVAINARAADISAFFNQGGGVVAFAGILNGDGVPVPPDSYYRFLPVPLNGKAVTGPFYLTPGGTALGIQDSVHGIGTNNDINCCPTHNSFLEPGHGLLQVAEREGSGAPESIFGEGTIAGNSIVPGALTGEIIDPPSSKCVRRRSIKIRIRQPRRTRIRKATVFLNGKRVRVLRRRAFRGRRSVTIRLRKLPKRTARVRIVVRTTRGAVHRTTRKYRICRSERKV